MSAPLPAAEPRRGELSGDDGRSFSPPPRIPRRLLLAALGFTAALLVIHLTPAREYLADLGRLKTMLLEAGVWGSLIFLALNIGAVAFGCPRLLFAALGGLTFGPLEGLILAQLGTVIGSTLSFLFWRWGSPALSARVRSRFAGFFTLLESRPLIAVFVLRQTPVSGVFINLLLGWTGVKPIHFVTGSFLGFLPAACAAAFLGDSFARGSLSTALLQAAAAFAGLLVLFTVGARLLKKVMGRRRVEGIEEGEGAPKKVAEIEP